MLQPWQRPILFEITAFFLGISGCILMKIDSKQPKPYMDEIFHIPQAQKYCSGLYREWDPMITTLPGLYIASMALMEPISWFLGAPMKMLCSTFWLRSINVFFAVGNLCLLTVLFIKLKGEKYKEGKDNYLRCILSAVAISILPVLYFFTFLYYTDPGSVFFVLLTYSSSIFKQHQVAAVSGVISVLFRQTNIVWVAFCAMLIVGEHLIKHVKKTMVDTKEKKKPKINDLKFLQRTIRVLLLETKLYDLFKLALTITHEVWTYLLVGLAFVAFVIVNNGIVVGAKDAHEAGLHFPQLLYFSAFCVGLPFSLYVLPNRIKLFINFLFKNVLLVLLIGGVCYCLIWKYTFAHKYLLSDNRHYTFYVWSKIFRRTEYMKYYLIPVYLFALWNIYYSLKAENILWKLAFSACVICNLVPSMLLEFRYFIIPYIFFRLHSPLPSYREIATEIILNTALNIATLYIFMEKPFSWDSEPNVLQRFMW